jgi:hypothetical protein
MASTYPTSLDTFTNPTATSLLTSPSHSGLHSDINDAVEALEAKVAVGNTVLGVYTTTTPTFNNLTLGDGTVTGAYCRVNDFVHFYGRLTFGSTTAITGSLTLNLPINVNSTQTLLGQPLGQVTTLDFSVGSYFDGEVMSSGSATNVLLRVIVTNATYGTNQAITSTAPFTWAVSDRLHWEMFYRAA